MGVWPGSRASISEVGAKFLLVRIILVAALRLILLSYHRVMQCTDLYCSTTTSNYLLVVSHCNRLYNCEMKKEGHKCKLKACRGVVCVAEPDFIVLFLTLVGITFVCIFCNPCCYVNQRILKCNYFRPTCNSSDDSEIILSR